MKIRSVEFLRGLAAFSVAVAHCDSTVGGNPLLPFGRWHAYAMPGTAGVEFFFVLSGFVMAVAHSHEIGRGGNVGAFLWKRFCRIYPLYWLLLAVPVYRFWGAPILTPEALGAWISLLPIRTDNLLVVAWTLRQEVTFYLMLALCLLPYIGGPILLAWVGLTVTWWFATPPLVLQGVGATVVQHVFSLFNFEFFAGLLAGLLYRRLAGPKPLGWLLLTTGIGIVGWRMSLDGWGVEYGPVAARPIYGLGYGLVILGAALLERNGAIRLGPRATAFAAGFGALSYPLYLSHLLALDVVVGLIGPTGIAAWLGPDLTFCLLLTSAVLAGWVLTILFDRPMQRLLRRITAGSRSPRSAPG